ncbi:MAG: ABC transporter permease, partial [Geminicoccaceae bacterium]
MSATLISRLTRGTGPSNAVGLLALLVALVLLFTLLLPGRFDNYGTVQSMMFQLPELGLLALAMVIPLISGGLNLAIIATTNQCALLMAWIMSTWMPVGAGGIETAAIVALALLAGLVLCTAIGLLTGFLVATMGVHPILVTLGTKSLIDGVSIWLTRGTVVSGLPESFQWLGNGVLLGVPVPFLVLILAAVAVGLVLTRTSFGISIYMLGSNL